MKAPKHPEHLYADGVIVASEDFSDYMWMEDVESFDKEVMAELQEEEEMEQCIEEMLAEEEARDTTYYVVEEVEYPAYPCLAYPSLSLPLIEDCDDLELEQSMANLRFSDERILIVSELNPDAEEFIPSRHVAGSSTSTNNNNYLLVKDEELTKPSSKSKDEPDR